MTVEGPDLVEARPGGTFVISLEAVPASGYTWQEEHDPALLEVLRANDYASSSDAVGAGGTETFEFRALKPGETELRFRYARAWGEQPSVDERRYRVRIAN